jgi:putative flippase GtrA
VCKEGTIIRRILNIRIVRYALVGNLGIPILDGALFVFMYLLGNGALVFPLAYAGAFEVGTTINFVLNQLFTYHDQRHLRGWQWGTRALQAQVTSISAFLFAFGISLALKDIFGVNVYIATPLGNIGAFLYNFMISRRFVFQPEPAQNYEARPAASRLVPLSASSRSSC